jgi:hypothetical protein
MLWFLVNAKFLLDFSYDIDLSCKKFSIKWTTFEQQKKSSLSANEHL